MTHVVMLPIKTNLVIMMQSFYKNKQIDLDLFLKQNSLETISGLVRGDVLVMQQMKQLVHNHIN